jgi:hypothetical protein
MEFQKVNLNPKLRRSADCVIRALAYADGKDWNIVYKELCEIGFKYKIMPDEKSCFERYLKKHGFVKHKMPKHYDGTRYTVEQFLDDAWDYCGFEDETHAVKMVISVAQHLTSADVDCDYSTLFDTWDCSYKYVGNFWTKEYDIYD